MLNADVTGLMAKAKPGWEKRVEALAQPRYFKVLIDIEQELLDQLSGEELHRLNVKLDLVERYAQLMCAGMLKGTLKYAMDEYSVAQWMAHLLGEGSDFANYQILLADAWGRNQ